MNYIAILTRTKQIDRPFACVNELLLKQIIDHNCIPKIIYIDYTNEQPINYYINQIKDCSGLILQGGDTITKTDKKIAKYCHEQNIPTLGICLGCQIIACAFGGKLKKVNHHFINRKINKTTEALAHKIYIKPNNFLYDLFGNSTSVTSLHHYQIKNTNLKTIATSKDNIIEAIIDPNKNFFLGVQWHPELQNNKKTNLLFNYFFKQCHKFEKKSKNIKKSIVKIK